MYVQVHGPGGGGAGGSGHHVCRNRSQATGSLAFLSKYRKAQSTFELSLKVPKPENFDLSFYTKHALKIKKTKW
jgi:hypothetical protein